MINVAQDAVESTVVGMYNRHPFPSFKDKLTYAERRMELRLLCCGITREDYVNKQVLDAGCGTGEYSSWFASHGANVTGIDLSEASLREASNYVESRGLKNVQFQRRSVLKTDLPDAKYDLVYCTGVLHHTADPFAGFVELCRVLRPGGKILISLYTSLGKQTRKLRWIVAGWLGGTNLNQRVKWGRRLFPFVARRELSASRHHPESGLYDYFAIPCESHHRVGEILHWLDHEHLKFMGTFPPTHLKDFRSMLASREFEPLAKKWNLPIRKLVARDEQSSVHLHRRPGFVSRGVSQLAWGIGRVPIFSICGQKPLH